MDAKLSPDQGLNISGIGLVSFLGFGLGVAALVLDLIGNRSPWQGMSLTLPLLFCAVASAAVGYLVVPKLQELKAGQIIREDGPQAHLKKAGTPTMGGIFFIPVAVLVACVWSNFSTEVLAVSALTLSYGLVGWLDDWQILRRKSNKGISPKMKLALQVGFGVLFCIWMVFTQPLGITNIALPLGLSLPLGWLLFLPLAGFVLVAESNATNLTDGIDGLAGGTVAIALLALGAIVAPTSIGLMVFLRLSEW